MDKSDIIPTILALVTWFIVVVVSMRISEIFNP
jgi:hypothetical protein